MKTETHVIEARQRHHAALKQLADSLGKNNYTGLALWRKLRRIEQRAHAGATARCNGERFETFDFCSNEDDWDTFTSQIENCVVRVLGGTPPKFYVNGDARGYALKLDSSEGGRVKATPFALESDWGSNQILAPVIE